MPQPKGKCVSRDQYDAVLFDLERTLTRVAVTPGGPDGL
jgi:hypothetical protein